MSVTLPFFHHIPNAESHFFYPAPPPVYVYGSYVSAVLVCGICVTQLMYPVPLDLFAFSWLRSRSWLWLRLRLRSYVLVCSRSWSPGSGYVTYVHRYILLPCLWCWCGTRSGYVHGLLVTVTLLTYMHTLYVYTVAPTFYITYIHATLLYILNTIGIR